MKYARLKAGELTPAPRTAAIGSQTVCNPTKEQYLSIGWYPVVFTDAPELPPDSTDMAVPHWEQREKEIVQAWDIVPIPEPEPLAPPEITLKSVDQKASENRQLIDILISGQTEEVASDGISGTETAGV